MCFLFLTFVFVCVAEWVSVCLFTVNMHVVLSNQSLPWCVRRRSVTAAILSYGSASTLSSSVMKRVVKYRWQIDRLKSLQAHLGIVCAKIPFVLLSCSLLSIFLRSIPLFCCILLCLLVKYICFCVGLFCLYFSYGNNWHIYCIWLFIVFFYYFLLSSFAVRWVVTDGLWWGVRWCVIVLVVRASCCQRQIARRRPIVLPARTLTVRVFRAWRLRFACVWVLEMLGGTK